MRVHPRMPLPRVYASEAPAIGVIGCMHRSCLSPKIGDVPEPKKPSTTIGADNYAYLHKMAIGDRPKASEWRWTPSILRQCPPEVPVSGLDQRRGTGWSSGEAVQRRQRSARRYFEDRPTAQHAGPARAGGPVEVTVGGLDQPRGGLRHPRSLVESRSCIAWSACRPA